MHLSWDLFKTIWGRVNEDWIVGGDLNKVLHDSKKSGGHRKSRVAMDDFRKANDELTLVDIKPDKEWYT